MCFRIALVPSGILCHTTCAQPPTTSWIFRYPCLTTHHLQSVLSMTWDFLSLSLPCIFARLKRQPPPPPCVPTIAPSHYFLVIMRCFVCSQQRQVLVCRTLFDTTSFLGTWDRGICYWRQGRRRACSPSWWGGGSVFWKGSGGSQWCCGDCQCGSCVRDVSQCRYSVHCCRSEDLCGRYTVCCRSYISWQALNEWSDCWRCDTRHRLVWEPHPESSQPSWGRWSLYHGLR